MKDRKFTDEDIKDSLRYHASRSLARCCQCAYLECNENCSELLAKDALTLINRQKAEIERLTLELAGMRGAANSYKIHYEKLEAERDEARRDAALAEKNHALAVAEREANVKGFAETIAATRAVAILGFAEKLKNEMLLMTRFGDGENVFAIGVDQIDELVKETTGGIPS